jgi:hypothetical protein
MMELLIVGSWLFWVFLAVFSIVAIATIDKKESGLLVFTTFLFLVCFGRDIANNISLSELAAWLGGYIVIGMGWTVFKWWLHVARIRREISSLDFSRIDNWKFSELKDSVNPSSNKAKITKWGVYWPWSVLWSSIHDVVEAVYNTLLGTYERIAAGTLAELENKGEGRKKK